MIVDLYTYDVLDSATGDEYKSISIKAVAKIAGSNIHSMQTSICKICRDGETAVFKNRFIITRKKRERKMPESLKGFTVETYCTFADEWERVCARLKPERLKHG